MKRDQKEGLLPEMATQPKDPGETRPAQET